MLDRAGRWSCPLSRPRPSEAEGSDLLPALPSLPWLTRASAGWQPSPTLSDPFQCLSSSVPVQGALLVAA